MDTISREEHSRVFRTLDVALTCCVTKTLQHRTNKTFLHFQDKSEQRRTKFCVGLLQTSFLLHPLVGIPVLNQHVLIENVLNVDAENILYSSR